MAFDFKKDLRQGDDRWRDWMTVSVLWVASLALLSVNTSGGSRWLRFCASVLAATTSGLAAGKVRQIGQLEEFRAPRDIMRQDLFLEIQSQQIPSVRAQSIGQSPEVFGELAPAPEIEYYDWDALVDEAVGLVIAGQSGSGKTSVASWALGKLTANEPAKITVCDPHYNDLWGDLGLPTIGEFEDIQNHLAWLVKELDRRRGYKRDGLPMGDPLIVVADEVGACIESFSDPKVIATALKRIGSEGRKFGITLIAIDQSPNSSDLGISAKKRDNFLMIGLCSVAIALAKYDNKKESPIMQALSSVAYPCVVSLGGILTPAIHPTHGSYDKFKKKGNPPKNLLPINQIPQTPILEKLPAATEPISDPLANLEKSWQLEPAHPTPDGCPHCGSPQVIRHGKTQAGTERRKCSDCGKTWVVS